MIEVTDEMREAYRNAQEDLHASVDAPEWEDLERVGLEAVFALIDPVPNDVRVITDRDGDRWHRSTDDPMVWGIDDYMRVSILKIQKEYGPITWEGKQS